MEKHKFKVLRQIDAMCCVDDCGETVSAEIHAMTTEHNTEGQIEWRVSSCAYEDATVTNGTTTIKIIDSAYKRPLDQGDRPRRLAVKIAASLNTDNTEARCVKCGYSRNDEEHDHCEKFGDTCVFPNTQSPEGEAVKHRYIPTQLYENSPCAWDDHPDGIGDPRYYCGKSPNDPVHITDEELQGVQTQDSSVEAKCKCGASKDDPIHSISTEFQKSHSFDDAKTPLPNRARTLRAAQGDGVVGDVLTERHSSSGVLANPDRDKSLAPETETSESSSFSSPDTAELPEIVTVVACSHQPLSLWPLSCIVPHIDSEPKVADFARVHPHSKGGEGEEAEVFDELRKDLAFMIGRVHSFANHKEDVLRCLACDPRMKALLRRASSIAVTRTPSQVESEAARRPIDDVSVALTELRAMFPQLKSRIIITYDPDPGAPYTSICLSVDDDHDPEHAFTRPTLSEAMEAVRASLPPPPPVEAGEG